MVRQMIKGEELVNARSLCVSWLVCCSFRQQKTMQEPILLRSAYNLTAKYNNHRNSKLPWASGVKLKGYMPRCLYLSGRSFSFIQGGLIYLGSVLSGKLKIQLKAQGTFNIQSILTVRVWQRGNLTTVETVENRSTTWTTKMISRKSKTWHYRTNGLRNRNFRNSNDSQRGLK